MSPFLNPPFIIAILIALSVHEWAHGYAAYKLGDPTAKIQRQTYIEPIGSLGSHRNFDVCVRWIRLGQAGAY